MADTVDTTPRVGDAGSKAAAEGDAPVCDASPSSPQDCRNDAAIAEALHNDDADDAARELAADEDLARVLSQYGDEDQRHISEPAPPWYDEAITALLTGLSAASWARPPASGVDETTVSADRARLQALLTQHGLEEAHVVGDGACQFRAVADQLYRSERYHPAVRAAVVRQLRSCPERYAPFVSDWPSYEAYCDAMERPATWGDHVTLQAASDAYGCRIAVVTTYAQAAYLEVLPHGEGPRTQRCLWLCLHAEVHYNALYPVGEVPVVGPARVEQLEGKARRD